MGRSEYQTVGFRPELLTWSDEELGDVPGNRCWLYFIQCQTTKRVKIGISADVEGRLKWIRQVSPTQVEILCKIKTRSGLESVLHEQFAKYRLHGEWFEFSDEIREYVEKQKGYKPVVHRCPTCGRQL